MSELIVAMDFADPGDLLACAGCSRYNRKAVFEIRRRNFFGEP